MLKAELLELIHNGESSGVELKRDDVHPDSLAKEMAALLNLEGGYILLGVEDDAAVTGLTRAAGEAGQWVVNVARNNLQPPIIPYWETVKLDSGEQVGVVMLPDDAPDKPYKAKRGNAWVTFVRVGSHSREATHEEEARLYQTSGLMRYDIRPVPGASQSDLSLRRLIGYFGHVRGQAHPEAADRDGWQLLLMNTDLMVAVRDKKVPTVGGMLLFGENPTRFLPQAGITAVAYPGPDKDYAARERARLDVALVPALSESGDTLERGLVDQALDFVRRNIATESELDQNGRRQDRWDYPLEAVREAIVNAVAHRDYSIAVTDIELSIYSDRMEIISPGRLPNTVTVEKMRHGYRATRNELVKEVLRDFRYVEATGLGVPRKIIKGMREHNGTEPDLIEQADRFIVRLWKSREAGAQDSE